MPSAEIPGVLLDRDGVINRERADYVKRWSEFSFLPGALDALRRLAVLGRPVLVVTNQSPVGRGLLARAALDEIHRRMRDEVARHGGRIDGVYVCPHRPDQGCDCRKPRPGLLEAAAREWSLALAESVFVGDAVSDWEAARSAGCRSILVRSGRQGRDLAARFAGHGEPALVDDLAGAVDLIGAER